MIFEIKNGKAEKIDTKDFNNELELHQLIDNNLMELFEIRYIKDEHITDKHGRIETLGLDSSNRPVVIEYKKTKERGQLMQANRYAMWINQHNAEFELLVRKNLKIEDEIDFSNIRIICFAQEYNIDDKCLAAALGAELWKYQYYNNDTLVIVRDEEPEQLVKSKPQRLIKSEPKKTQKEYTTPKSVEDHLNNAPTEVVRIFRDLDKQIMNISSEIDRYATGANILYKTSVSFLEVKLQKGGLKLLLRTKNRYIQDPKGLTRQVPETHGWGNLSHEVVISVTGFNAQALSDTMDLILQSYKTTV